MKTAGLDFFAGKLLKLNHFYHNRLDSPPSLTQTCQQQRTELFSHIKPLSSQVWHEYVSSGAAVNSQNLCAECNISFPDPKSFQAHMHTLHQKFMPYVCSLCGKCYGSAGGLQHHMRAHDGKSYVCPVCDSTFSQSGTMNRHLKTVHNSGQCSICKGIFKLGDDYNHHVLHCKSRMI